jgi:hypothetical protein
MSIGGKLPNGSAVIGFVPIRSSIHHSRLSFQQLNDKVGFYFQIKYDGCWKWQLYFSGLELCQQ